MNKLKLSAGVRHAPFFKKRWLPLVLGAFILCGLLGGGVVYYWHRALPGQTMNGYPVGGKTYQELVTLAHTQTNLHFSVQYDTTTVNASAQDVGLTFTAADTAQAILQHHSLGDLFARHNFLLTHTIDSQKLAAYISSSLIHTQLVNAIEPTLTYTASQHSFSVTAGKAGQAFDLKSVEQRIDAAAAYPPQNRQVPVTVTVGAAQPDVSTQQAELLAQQATQRSALGLTFSYNGTVRYTLQPDDTAQWFGLSPAGLVYNAAAISQTLSAQLGPLINQAPVSQKMSGGAVVSAGHTGLQITGLDSLTQQVENSLKAQKAAALTVQATPIAFDTVLVDQSCKDNSGGKLILVSISQQHLWACDGTQLANDSAVTTGASALTNVDDATPTGTWSIYGKSASVYLSGSDANGSWHDFVNYWMPFYGGYGFHDSSWQTFAYGSSLYTTQGSHGCVHVPLDVMKWLYTWSSIGTKVTVTG